MHAEHDIVLANPVGLSNACILCRVKLIGWGVDTPTRTSASGSSVR